MENESGFTHLQSLEIIQSMINKVKGRFSEDGHMYLLWGWVILICSMGHFILLHYLQYDKHYMIWLLTWMAIIYQMIYLYRTKRNLPVINYTDDIISFVWVTFVVLMFLFGFLFGRMLGEEYFRFINPGFLALYGMPTFLSGLILRVRRLVIGGICCWLLSVLSTTIPYDYQLLLLGAAVIIAWIIPGYILRARFKKINT
jgi:hypothetical protein